MKYKVLSIDGISCVESIWNYYGLKVKFIFYFKKIFKLVIMKDRIVFRENFC